jgi:hypothetical protein
MLANRELCYGEARLLEKVFTYGSRACGRQAQLP